MARAKHAQLFGARPGCTARRDRAISVHYHHQRIPTAQPAAPRASRTSARYRGWVIAEASCKIPRGRGASQSRRTVRQLVPRRLPVLPCRSQIDLYPRCADTGAARARRRAASSNLRRTGRGVRRAARGRPAGFWYWRTRAAAWRPLEKASWQASRKRVWQTSRPAVGCSGSAKFRTISGSRERRQLA
jgi:hypothetical protein